ncbi:MAG: acetolactate synthase large subunit [Clostridium baratii]|uniref:thiamine pyrophosphate-dependent enzyme n=1 Tax=Clostridium baratii TaxID=1561 RepID=UPI0024323495|nr:thiamine pyrophosphate-dependent enzyme [Clostridium baratii]MBS6007416.1 acetolactate synthase large subunit [Clostridium baratii]
MLLTGAEILVKSLIDEGVDTLFGYPGGSVLNIYDSLYKYKDEIKHVLTCHEQNAAHAADGYARATGKVGVCIATSGPGATNLVTGIATAYMDSIPIVAITGNVNKPLLGKDSFQEVDIQGITMPITKHNYIVKDIKDLQKVIKEAFKIAKSGRPGPVLIAFAEKIDSPVCTSLMGKGAISEKHSLYTGMIGMHGTKASNIAATKCDLLIALGARFSDRVIVDPENISNAKVIHIDVDAAEINKNIKVDSFIVGDLKVVLEKLTSLVKENNHEEWNNTVNRFKEVRCKEDNESLTPKYLFDKINELNKDGNILITTEVGQHQMWAAQYFNTRKERSFLSSGGLGTMGYGIGASIGASFGRPNAKVINIAGDGSFGMNCNELATAVSNDLPIIVIVMNNNSLGMVRQWQCLFYEERYSETTLNRKTDFVKLAEAFGGVGYRITEREEVEPVLEEALNSKKLVVIDYVINSNKKVFPMVAPGAPINQIIDEENV